MAYNYPPPGSYGAPPGMGPPPGMGAAPGIGGAAMSPPPGLFPPQTSQPALPGVISAQFQPPPNIGNINFSAPVIRMGVSNDSKPAPGYGYDSRKGSNTDALGGGYSGRSRQGLGADSRGGDYGRQPRENTLVPPTREEVFRTIFVGGLVDGVPNDDALEALMRAGGGLRRWTRVTDAGGKLCTFGFAEYEDAASLEVANQLFKDIEIPLTYKSKPVEDDEDGVKHVKLTVIIDPKSEDYISGWVKDENDLQFKIDSGREALSAILARMTFDADNTNGTSNGVNHDGESRMDDGTKADNAELITIPASAEDELSDIPAEMRETVAAEIAAFRDRSVRRDLERLRQEEEMEKAERQRSGLRVNRLASPPLSVPSGPGGANGVPVGPRDRTVHGAPVGPKGFRGAQLPKDYADGVAFVNGYTTVEDENDSASDSELERRRKARRDEKLEQAYLDQEKRWLQREKAHFSAVERQQKEEDAAAAAKQRKREELAERLRSFDDEAELRKPTSLYYRDRKAWARDRRGFRSEEKRRDDHDRRDEERHLASEQRRKDAADGRADTFLAQASQELEARNTRAKPTPRTFTLNLGALGGAKPSDDADDLDDAKPARQSIADVEGLLDDEDDAAAAAGSSTERKPLRTAAFKPLAAGEKLTDEERRAATQQLAASIPTDSAALYAWPVQWAQLQDGAVLRERLRPYVQKKVMEVLGVQEEMLVEAVEDILRNRGSAADVRAMLEDTLDEEAEAVTRKVWRMVVFYSESEARGLGT